mmetsp:Transcript_6556/g.12240  ORF Transcript_6556/g.12240 Transcript_6556/m.12240 type:complete len:204 (-) Transcript_6556:1489-2100(-)
MLPGFHPFSLCNGKGRPSFATDSLSHTGSNSCQPFLSEQPQRTSNTTPSFYSWARSSHDVVRAITLTTIAAPEQTAILALRQTVLVPTTSAAVAVLGCRCGYGCGGVGCGSRGAGLGYGGGAGLVRRWMSGNGGVCVCDGDRHPSHYRHRHRTRPWRASWPCTPGTSDSRPAALLHMLCSWPPARQCSAPGCREVWRPCCSTL